MINENYDEELETFPSPSPSPSPRVLESSTGDPESLPGLFHLEGCKVE